MARQDNIYQLPKDLPIPIDDGGCNHLPGMQLPSVLLMSTTGRAVDLAKMSGRTVVYCYPRTGRPEKIFLKDGMRFQALEDARLNPAPFATTIKSYGCL